LIYNDVRDVKSFVGESICRFKPGPSALLSLRPFVDISCSAMNTFLDGQVRPPSEKKMAYLLHIIFGVLDEIDIERTIHRGGSEPCQLINESS